MAGLWGEIDDELPSLLSGRNSLLWLNNINGGAGDSMPSMFPAAAATATASPRRAAPAVAGWATSVNRSPSTPPTPAQAPAMSAMQPKEGLLGGFEDRILSPLFLGGAALLSGEGMGGALRGMQVGAGFQDQRRQLAEQERQKQAFQGLLAQGDYTPQQRGLLEAAGPAAFPLMLKQQFPDRLSPTDDQREYAQAQQQGFKGTFMDYLTSLKKAGAQVTNIDLKQEGAYDKEIGGLLAKEFVESQKASSGANEALGDLAVMKSMLANPNVYLGTGGNQVQAVKKAAQTLFGVDVKGVPEGEIIQRSAAKIALGLKDNLPGPMSNADREFLMSLPANLAASPEGARRVVELGMAQKQWQIERAAAVRDYAAKNKGRLDPGVYQAVSAIDQRWAKQMGALAQQLQAGVQAPARAPTAGVPDAFKQKYGLE
jgi:hypothetical protein